MFIALNKYIHIHARKCSLRGGTTGLRAAPRTHIRWLHTYSCALTYSRLNTYEHMYRHINTYVHIYIHAWPTYVDTARLSWHMMLSLIL